MKTENIFLLNNLLLKDIPNLLIISPSSRGSESRKHNDGTSFDLITSQFVSQENSADPRLLDTFEVTNEKFIENADLFPQKFADLQGRIMKISLFNYMPYAVWEEVVRSNEAP